MKKTLVGRVGFRFSQPNPQIYKIAQFVSTNFCYEHPNSFEGGAQTKLEVIAYPKFLEHKDF
jgi:hypothetical protein